MSGPPRRSKPTLRPSNSVLLMLISYSAKDEGIATLIHADLQNNGIRCRFSPHHTKIGDKILDAIRRLAQLLHAWPLGHAIGC